MDKEIAPVEGLAGEPQRSAPPAPPLADLLARVEAATGPDRDLDARLWCLAEGITFHKWVTGSKDWRTGLPGQHAFRTSAGDKSIRAVPYPTASLDAATALVERVLAGVEWHVLFAPDHGEIGCSYAGLKPRGQVRDISVVLGGKREPLALLAALLKVLIADSATPGDGLAFAHAPTPAPTPASQKASS